MAGCLRSAVLLALRSKVIETIGRLPGLFEKLQGTGQTVQEIGALTLRLCMSYEQI
jgi:hypothetical protein